MNPATLRNSSIRESTFACSPSLHLIQVRSPLGTVFDEYTELRFGSPVWTSGRTATRSRGFEKSPGHGLGTHASSTTKSGPIQHNRCGSENGVWGFRAPPALPFPTRHVAESTWLYLPQRDTGSSCFTAKAFDFPSLGKTPRGITPRRASVTPLRQSRGCPASRPWPVLIRRPHRPPHSWSSCSRYR